MKIGEENYLNQVKRYLIANNIVNFIKQAIKYDK